MKLNVSILNQTAELKKLGYQIPAFDVLKTIDNTITAPTWLHFGAGNIFRAFLTNIVQLHLNNGLIEKGIIAVEGYDYELIDSTYRAYDELGLLAILNADGSIEKTLLASIAQSLKADSANPTDWEQLKTHFTHPSLQMVSFTITEKGYSLTKADSRFAPEISQDFENGPTRPNSYLGKVTALLYHRYQQGELPLALVSMDNCSKNGELLQQGITTYAEQWVAKQLVDKGFLDYINNPDKVSFPWTMIDKITPRPDEFIEKTFNKDGFDNLKTIVTAKNTYCAPFANAEKPQYLIIEDWFPAGKPLPEGYGVFYTDRKHVSKAETMKVTTCLNPLHTALAIFGCLLGYTLIADEMKDDDLKNMVCRLGYQEGLPVVVNPEILDAKAFIDEVINERLPNPFIPDTPQRIASDTSQKIAIRFGETLRAYQQQQRDIIELEVIPFVLAGWLRYLLEIDDNGKPFMMSPDPLKDSLKQHLASITFGSTENYHDILKPLLSNASLFGIDLYEVGLGSKVEELFAKMITKEGAIRETMKAILND